MVDIRTKPVTITPTAEGVHVESLGAVLLKSGDSIKVRLIAEDGTMYDATVGVWRVGHASTD